MQGVSCLFLFEWATFKLKVWYRLERNLGQIVGGLKFMSINITIIITYIGTNKNLIMLYKFRGANLNCWSVKHL